MPSSPSPWRLESRRIIGEAIAADRDAKLSATAIRKKIDAAYPFGQREYWPYKIWLNDRRAQFVQHRLATEKERTAYANRKLLGEHLNRIKGPTMADWQRALADGLIA